MRKKRCARARPATGELFEANPHPMWVFDTETLGFLAVNDAAVAHYGWSREEFLAMTIADIRPAEDMPALLGHLAAETRRISAQSMAARHRKKDGTLIDVDIISHVLDFGGRRARVVTAIDITKRKRAEERLRANRALLRAIVNGTSDAIYVKDPRGRYVMFNAAAERFTGKSASDMFGKDDSFLFRPPWRRRSWRVTAGARVGEVGDLRRTDDRCKRKTFEFLGNQGSDFRREPASWLACLASHVT